MALLPRVTIVYPNSSSETGDKTGSETNAAGAGQNIVVNQINNNNKCGCDCNCDCDNNSKNNNSSDVNNNNNINNTVCTGITNAMIVITESDKNSCSFKLPTEEPSIDSKYVHKTYVTLNTSVLRYGVDYTIEKDKDSDNKLRIIKFSEETCSMLQENDYAWVFWHVQTTAQNSNENLGENKDENQDEDNENNSENKTFHGLERVLSGDDVLSWGN